MSNGDGFRILDPGREGRLEVTCVNRRASRKKARDKADSLVQILRNFAMVGFPDQQQPTSLGKVLEMQRPQAPS